MVGIAIPPSGGEGLPTMRWCLVPCADYRVEDTWVTCALRGTGSNTLVLDDVFIPEHRAVDPMLLMTGRAPGAEVNPSPVFRLSFSTALGWYLSSTALGSATRTVRDFVEYSKAKRSKFTGQPALNETMIVHIGTASAQLEAARSLMRHRTRLLDGLLAEGHVPTLDDALASSRDATTAVRLCVDVVERCMRFSGGSALFEHHTVQQGWRDVHGVAAHMGYNTDTIYGNWGRQLLGLTLPPGFV
jgi:3-hydroxy-9,10-secoandrosta-1,3,5(10)-triene-9,17-dione monooxygenase